MRDAAVKSIAVGFFDGVHLGHRRILEGADAALTFRAHPLSVLVPERAPVLIMSAEERVAAIRACGVKEVMVLDFTRELAEMRAEDFAERYFRGGKVRCGGNWRFGRGGEGDAALLGRMGIETEVVPFAEHMGERVSSSRIRECLRNGEVEAANAMLGRRFSVDGEPVRGKGLGAKLGFPTVNYRLSRVPGLKLGVYEVEAGGNRGIANFGIAPTMAEEAWKEPVLEVHFTDGRLPAGGQRIEFVRFLREERRFGSLDELKAQIERDCRSL